jgi:dienelactone hydrolase
MRWLAIGLGLAALVAVPAAAAPVAAKLVVSPQDALVDEPIDVRVVGLRPRERITLQALTRDANGDPWRSRVAFRANRIGIVDTRSDMRLFWSMAHVGARSSSAQTLVLPNPSSVEITALRGGRPIASSVLTRRTSDPNVSVTDLSLAKDGLVGTFSSQPTAAPRPALLTLGGSAGGHNKQPSVFASHGFPTLSLAYFGEPGLPSQLRNIPLEYFATALRWLGTQPGVDPNRIAVLGVSRGGELALLLAAAFPDLVHGAIACTTASHVLGADPGTAWTLGGKPVPFGLLPVDKISAPTLITGGGQDEIVDSAPATKQLLAFAHSHGRTNVVGRVYPKAGHGVGCRQPNLPIPSEVEESPGTFLSLGGTPAANAEAATAAWPVLLRFLDHL